MPVLEATMRGERRESDDLDRGRERGTWCGEREDVLFTARLAILEAREMPQRAAPRG